MATSKNRNHDLLNDFVLANDDFPQFGAYRLVGRGEFLQHLQIVAGQIGLLARQFIIHNVFYPKISCAANKLVGSSQPFP